MFLFASWWWDVGGSLEFQRNKDIEVNLNQKKGKEILCTYINN